MDITKIKNRHFLTSHSQLWNDIFFRTKAILAMTKAVLYSFNRRCSSRATAVATITRLGVFVIWFLDGFQLCCLAQCARVFVPWYFWLSIRHWCYRKISCNFKFRKFLEYVEPIQTFLSGMCVCFILVAIKDNTSGVVCDLAELAFIGVILVGFI